jgi:uncharacterized SAM-binding protein YcdF (DUF218 family)
MFELAKVAGFFLAPLTIVIALWLAAAGYLARQHFRLAAALAFGAAALLWVASMPVVASALVGSLEREYPAMSIAETPTADAILVLGGALAAPKPPLRPTMGMGPSATRIWHAAALYRAGKAPVVVVAAGGKPEFEGQLIEAEVIARMLVTLGVPESAIRLETRSRNTRENATNVRPVLLALGARRVLLVTSGQHMYRAVKTFSKQWAGAPGSLELIPVPADIAVVRGGHISLESLLPSAEALENVTRALKEYAGMVALAMI